LIDYSNAKTSIVLEFYVIDLKTLIQDLHYINNNISFSLLRITIITIIQPITIYFSKFRKYEDK